MTTTLRPQPGPQETFLSSAADVVLYGGAAGGGKSWSLLVEPLRHVHNPAFGAVLFRRTYPQITSEGGLWSESTTIYPHLGATANESTRTWTFPSGATVAFRHLQYDKDVLSWQGSQIPLIAFDEASHFSARQFWYMLSRNRSTCGVRPYVRMTTNPDPDSWLRTFIDWWIDDSGFPIPERGGVVRHFVREDGEIHWADSASELKDAFPGCLPKTFTFVPSSVHDNQILLSKDPGYLANLMAQDAVTRAQLLDGNWNARAAAGLYFKRRHFRLLDRASELDGARLVRFWDLAGTEPSSSNPDPDYTVGLLLAALADGSFVVLDVKRERLSPAGVEALVARTAAEDRERYGATAASLAIWMEQEPGSSGKTVVDHFRRRVLRGFDFHAKRATGDKVTRARPTSAAAEGGLIDLVRAPWTEALIAEVEAFPEGGHDDQVDALAGAHRALTDEPAPATVGALMV